MEQFFDIITITSTGALLLIALIAPLCSGFYRCGRLIRNKVDTFEDIENTNEDTKDVTENIKESTTLPTISIILNIEGESEALRHNLPIYLQQDYAGEYDVIIIIRKGDHEVEDVLSRYEDNPRVYSTYVPDSARYMSKPKLAVTLGGKASKSDWLMLADVNSAPLSDHWLTVMAANINNGTDMVLGYCQYTPEMSSFRRFIRLHSLSYLLGQSFNGTPYRSIGKNILFRKSMFLDQDGYRGNLKYTGGEYDFLVNKFATSHNTRTEINYRAWLQTELPTEKNWRNTQLFYQENRKHLNRSLRHRLPYVFDQCVMWFSYLLIIATIVYAAMTQNWLLLGAGVFSLILTITLRCYFAKRFITDMHEEIATFKLIPFELSTIWHNMYFKMKYLHSDKYDFISHKI